MSINLNNMLHMEINTKVRSTTFQFLLQHLKNEKLSHSVINSAATFNIHRSTISRLLKKVKPSKINEDEILNANSQKVVNAD